MDSIPTIFITLPTVLEDNYGHAVAFMRSMEMRLIKKGNLKHFNNNFQETIDRGGVQGTHPRGG